MLLLNNGKKIKIYSSDTDETIIRRIAISLNTLPKFIIVQDDIDLKTAQEVKVQNLLEMIKENATLFFMPFYNSIKNLIVDIPVELIFKFWVYYYKFDENKKSTQKLLIVNEAPIENFNIDEFLEDKDTFYKKNFSEPYERLKVEEEHWKNSEEDFREEKKVDMSKFYLINTIIEVRYRDVKYIISDIFDNIKTSKSLPFVVFNDYYKIYKGYTPSTINLISEQNTISCYIDGVKVRICIEEQVNGKFFSEFETNTLYISFNSSNAEKRDKILNILMNSMPNVKLKDREIKEDMVTGVFYIPNLNITMYIFADLIMNNKLVSNFLSVNEKIHAHKKSATLYIISSKKVSVNLTQKIVETGDKNIKRLQKNDQKLLKLGQCYVRVLVTRGASMENIREFMEIFSKILSIYEREKKNIYRFYKDYIKDIPFDISKIPYKALRTKVMLKDLEPEIFPVGYSRFCPNPPKIVDEPDENTIEFPKEGGKYYSCSECEGNPYIGLKRNTLVNKETYTYLPCCYYKDQKEKPGSNYQKYYFKDEDDTKGGQQRLITTNRISNFATFAYLPSNISSFFENIRDYHEFLRIGVNKSKNSFIEAVMMLLYKGNYESSLIPKNFINLKSDKMAEKISSFRKNLIKYQLNVVKQEMYDYNSYEIEQEILNEDVYFDPRKYVRLLEEVFNVNIFIFERKKNSSYGSMVIPRHVHNYLTMELPDRKTLVIYEHYGTNADNSEYPHCEGVLCWDNGKGIYCFDRTDDFTIKLKRMFDNVNLSYNLDNINKNIDKTQFNNVVSQYIDEFGKVRKIKTDNNVVIFLDSPIPPLENIPEEKMPNHSEYGQVKSYPIDLQKIYNDQTTNIHIPLGWVKITPIEVLPNIESEITLSCELPNNQNHKLDDYRFMSKLSRIVYEYVKFLYSKYIFSNKQKIGVKSVIEFGNEKIDIIPDYKYSTTFRNRFKLKNTKEGDIVINGNIILPNEECKKRVIGLLKLDIVHFTDSILNYRKCSYISSFYENSSDFKKRENEIIIKGVNNVSEIFTKLIKGRVAFKNITESETPYYFYNEDLGGLYICKNIADIEEGKKIGKYWYERDFIPSENELDKIKNDKIEKFDVSYRIYLFNDEGKYKAIKNVKGTSLYRVLIGVRAFENKSKKIYNVMLKV